MSSHPATPEPGGQRRGDKQRQAILQAVRELLQEKPFAELSVSTISLRAGVARSGFYFYFDSKYAVLAQLMAEAAEELEELTQDFAPRQPGESPEQFAKRMVGSAAAVYAHNDPVMTACNEARNTDVEIRNLMDQQFEVVLRPDRLYRRGRDEGRDREPDQRRPADADPHPCRYHRADADRRSHPGRP